MKQRDLLLPLPSTGLQVRVTLQIVEQFIQVDWSDPKTGEQKATGRIQCTDSNELTWSLGLEGRIEATTSSHHLNSIRAAIHRWAARFPANPALVTVFSVRRPPYGRNQEHPLEPGETPWDWLSTNVQSMAETMRINFSPLAKAMKDIDPLALAEMERDQRRFLRKERKREEEAERLRANMERLAEERSRREHRAAEAKKAAEARKATEAKAEPASPAAQAPPAERLPLPPVPTRIELPRLELQETTFPLADLRRYSPARARRAVVGVQPVRRPPLLAVLPHRAARLPAAHGLARARPVARPRAALRRSRAGQDHRGRPGAQGTAHARHGETVPRAHRPIAGRPVGGGVGRQVRPCHRHDQPRRGARRRREQFWRENPGLVASLHTLKQPAHLEIARQVHWDMLIVDEAHYLRNRESQAWQAVNALPRHFLLLLTATPVQNSLEELYNLVTLLQPGQLPTPKEFRARFIDPKRPRQPREPEELRRLLGQVMIRNTRANAGIQLPPRRAETVLFEPDEAGSAPSGSNGRRNSAPVWPGSPPARPASGDGCCCRLRAAAPRLGAKRCRSSRTATAGARLERAGAPRSQLAAQMRVAPAADARGRRRGHLYAIPPDAGRAGRAPAPRGRARPLSSTARRPPPERQPITEEFHARGGALLLTHSGTEGRNLQFSHRLANFDLPWNPMEIEQRIGRLHRLGQRHPVRIYNFVQAGTLQEHLLQILQEKLNLFELVVGETGLVLGERFTSDEFAEEVLRRWRDSEGCVAEALAGLGDELAAARDAYGEVKKLDETLFEKDYESL